MIKLPHSHLINELHRKQPYTLIAVLALIWYASWSYLNHALSTDLENLRTELSLEIELISDRATGNAQILSNIWGVTLAGELRAQQAVLCTVKKESAKRTLRRSLEQLQKQHFEATGHYYRLDESCKMSSSNSV